MALSDAAPFAISAWTFDEASGTRADQVGSDDLTDNNTVGSSTGKFGNAAVFVAANSEYLSVADGNNTFAGDFDFCIRLWAKGTMNLGGFQALVTHGAGDSGYSLFNQGGTTLTWRVFSGSGFGGAVDVSVTLPNDGAFHHIVVWHDAANNQIGIVIDNGTPVTATQSGGVHQSGGSLLFGSYPNYGQHSDSEIDDPVFLSGYILDSTEIAEDYNSGTGVAFADWDAGGGGDPEGSLIGGKLIRGGLLLHGVLGR